MFYKLAGFLLLALSLLAVGVRADGTVYEIIGSLTLPGNSANPGVGETINYSLELAYSPGSISGTQIVTMVGTPVITAFGPLGPFTVGPPNEIADYIGFFNSAEAIEIDLYGNFFPGAGLAPVPNQGFAAATLWEYGGEGGPALSMVVATCSELS